MLLLFHVMIKKKHPLQFQARFFLFPLTVLG